MLIRDVLKKQHHGDGIKFRRSTKVAQSDSNNSNHNEIRQNHIQLIPNGWQFAVFVTIRMYK